MEPINSWELSKAKIQFIENSRKDVSRANDGREERVDLPRLGIFFKGEIVQILSYGSTK